MSLSGEQLQQAARDAAGALADVGRVRVVALRRDHPSITPGRHLDKRHWVSVGPGRGVTQGLVEDLVPGSYELVTDRLPSKGRSGG